MARLQRAIAGDAKEIAERLHAFIASDEWSLSLVETSSYCNDGVAAYLYLYTRLFTRFGGRANLSVSVSGHSGQVAVIAIASDNRSDDGTFQISNEDEKLIAIVDIALNEI